ncbi:hypothetical protein KCP75_23790 [Salmonella enterica subsp. enterica]|nr:hypothetical protein KCP75_23790 [Salmonella enterica subsp. enterica]
MPWFATGYRATPPPPTNINHRFALPISRAAPRLAIKPDTGSSRLGSARYNLLSAVSPYSAET